MLCVWLYGFMTGIRSSRKLEAACRDQIPYLWLTGWQNPDHNTLWRFYKDHRQAMRSLFKRTVQTAIAMELVDLALQAVDGTKVAASAARERNYDAKRLGKLLERVEKAIVDLEAQNQAGEGTAPAHLPEELAEKRVLRDRVRHAMDDLASQEDPKSINLTDRDARMMKTRHGILPAYNAQAIVSPFDPEGGGGSVLITAVDLVDEPNDYGQLTPMLEKAEETTGSKVGMTLADGGYHSGRNLEECASRGQVVALPQDPGGGRQSTRTTDTISPMLRRATAISVPRVRHCASSASNVPERGWRGDTEALRPYAGHAPPSACVLRTESAAALWW